MSSDLQAVASAPASSANLGPAFDCLALALEMRCTVTAARSDQWLVEHVGQHRPQSGAPDAVLEAAKAAVGPQRPLRMTVDNTIPLARGLGSSSAAFAAGCQAAWRAVGEAHPVERLFEVVARLEGHPDNAAAAVFGGLVLATAGGSVRRLPWNPALAVTIAVPHSPLSTKIARTALPAEYPAQVVVRSLARASALVAGLLSGDPVLLAEAGGDELHEAHRHSMRPELSGLIEAARDAGAFHAAWSGAGPSVLAITSVESVDRVAARLEAQLGDSGTVMKPRVAASGTL